MDLTSVSSSRPAVGRGRIIASRSRFCLPNTSANTSGDISNLEATRNLKSNRYRADSDTDGHKSEDQKESSYLSKFSSVETVV